MNTSFRFWNKVLDALPNIKIVKIVNFDFENLPVFLKNISVLKHLKSLNVAIRSHYDGKFDAQKFGHVLEIRDCCEIIKNNFPKNSEVVIADLAFDDDYLTNLIEKKVGKNPEIVNGLGQSWFTRYFN